MTITEALAELKTLKKRRAAKVQFITQNAVRDARLKDPLQNQGGTETVLKQELQALTDLNERFVKIRSAIAAANSKTKVAIEGLDLTIAEWLIWRREVAPELQTFYAGLQQQIGRAKSMMDNPRYPSTPGDPPKVEYGIDERGLTRNIEQYETILGTLDGQLSLKNATTSIEV